MLQKRHEVLANRRVRCCFEDDVRLLLNQLCATDDIPEVEFACERRPARFGATTRERDEFDARELPGSSLLQNEACNSAAPQHGYPDFVLQLV